MFFLNERFSIIATVYIKLEKTEKKKETLKVLLLNLIY